MSKAIWSNKAAAFFRFDPLSLQLISRSTNDVYRCLQDGKPIILRVSERSERHLATIDAELEWIFYLSTHGLDVSLPIKGHDDRYSLFIQDQDSNSFTTITAFEMVRGKCPDPNDPTLWGPNLFNKWGETMGKMHHASTTFVPKKSKRDEWHRLQINNPFLHQGKYALLVERMRSLEKVISMLPKDRGSYGFVHYDLHPYNFFVHNGELSIFDFDDCLYAWFALDIAIAAVHASWVGCPKHNRQSKNEFSRDFLDSFMTGYSTAHSLEPFWIKQIPMFMDYRNISSYFWWLNNWNGDEDMLSEHQRDVIDYAVQLIKTGKCFDGCDIQV